VSTNFTTRAAAERIPRSVTFWWHCALEAVLK
jgi:hypothetical protein